MDLGQNETQSKLAGQDSRMPALTDSPIGFIVPPHPSRSIFKRAFFSIAVLLIIAATGFVALTRFFGYRPQKEKNPVRPVSIATKSVTELPPEIQMEWFGNNYGIIRFPQNPEQTAAIIADVPLEVKAFVPSFLKQAQAFYTNFSDGRTGFKVTGLVENKNIEEVYFGFPTARPGWNLLKGIRSTATAFLDYESEKFYLRVSLISGTENQASSTFAILQTINKQ